MYQCYKKEKLDWAAQNRGPVQSPSAFRLEDHLQRKLNLPHRNLRVLVNQAKAGNRERIKHVEVVSWRCEVRSVKDIEELRTELDIDVFTELRDVVILDKGHIDVELSRPNDRVAGQVAQQIGTGEWAQAE